MKRLVLLTSLILLSACQSKTQADILITNGQVFVGDNSAAQSLVVAIKDDKIVYVGRNAKAVKSIETIDASGLYVLPGFIDPHTHSLSDLTDEDKDKRANWNYQFQGVTTVINGNDGFGDPDISKIVEGLSRKGFGTNTALFIGHGALRKSVMGGEKRAPTADEMQEMRDSIKRGMEAGALGLSTGLFYAPGSFSNTDEVISLAQETADHGGVYDSHIRDEATYNIGLEAAVDEVIDIARATGIHTNISHIKALGVDVWGKSNPVIDKIEKAQAEGLSISADQYPWRASGTRISNALLPRWVKAGSEAEYLARLEDVSLAAKIKSETTENLRKRGGPSAVLITQDKFDWQNKTLGEIAEENGVSPVDMAIEIARQGDARIASFNMNNEDIENFMSQEWVMTSSDGSTGHPRKFASYPRKYTEYVQKKQIMPVETFFYRSSGLVADIFGICDRGYLKEGYKADIAIIDPEGFQANADFQNPDVLSSGVSYLFVNGIQVIHNSQPQEYLPGEFVKRCKS